MTIELILFNIFVVIMVILDLHVFNKKSDEINIKKALGWSLFWIILSLTFNLFIYILQGQEKALEFLTAYIVEKSLSIDNLFFILIIFNFLKIPKRYQHKVLLWGVMGALVMRAVFILVGVALIERFHFLIYIFGAFLIFTSIKIIFKKDTEEHLEHNFIFRIFKKFLPITHELHNEKFFIKIKHPSKITKKNTILSKWIATPLFVALIMIESTDLIFALDSIPAVLAITQDPFIAYTSNIFAVMGLRALYFAISHLIPKFIYLHMAIAVILGFIGLKMIAKDFFEIPTIQSLGVIFFILALSITASMIHANICKNKK